MTGTVEYTIHPSYILEKGPPIIVRIDDVPGLALLDTGASRSVMDITMARAMGLPEDETQGFVAGATGRSAYPQFQADLYIPDLEYTLPSPIQGLPLRENDHPWIATIGRDVICRYEFTVNGQTGLIRFVSP